MTHAANYTAKIRTRMLLDELELRYGAEMIAPVRDQLIEADVNLEENRDYTPPRRVQGHELSCVVMDEMRDMLRSARDRS